MESRKDKFKRLAEKRTNEVLEKLRILGNLSNRSSYDYNSEDIAKIMSAIEDQLRIVRSKFKTIRQKDFKL